MLGFRTTAYFVAVGMALVACAQSDQVSSSGTKSSGSGGNADCITCVTSSDCASGSQCVQIAGDTYCAPTCSDAASCKFGHACTPVSAADGTQVSACVAQTNTCADDGDGGASSASTTSASTSASGGAEVCGSLQGPDVAACCKSCTPGKNCQANGCYGGWWCNADTCKCQSPPANCGSSSAASSSSSTSSSSSSSSGAGGNGGSVGPGGGTLDTLSFAIVGDTRPATIEDTAGYPKAIISKIWQDVEAHSPRPAFAVSTGDYMFAKPYASQGAAQLDLYLAARAAFSGPQYPAMGNHECTGAVASNCGQGNADGITNNYSAFLTKMLAPLNVTKPYYTINIASSQQTWTAKFVFVAANAWDATQAAWFSSEMAKSTTYTFVVRHEGSVATTAPGVTPSKAIMDQHPYTLLLAGHTHTYAYYANEKQVIVGNGGAPVTNSVNYGYVIARQRADGAIQFQEFDYDTNAMNASFAVKANGAPTP